MERGEIRWVMFKPPDKRRPVLILTRQELIPHLSDVVVAPLTTTIRQTKSHVSIDAAEGLAVTSAIKPDNLVSVQRQNVGARICTLSDEQMEHVNRAIEYALGTRE